MKIKGILSLFVVAALLSGFYFFYLLPHKHDKALKEDLSKRFFSGRPEDIEFIKVAYSGAEFIIRKIDGVWMLQQPINTRADKKAVADIAETLDKERVKSVIPVENFQNVHEFGLSAPRAYLLVGYKGMIEEYLIGDRTPTGSGVYIMKRGVPAVFVVEKDMGRILVNDLYYFRNKDAFDFDAQAVTRVIVTRKNDRIEMVRKGKEWQISGAYSGPGSTRDIEEFLNNVKNLQADEFFDKDAERPYNIKSLTRSAKIELYTDRNAPSWIIEVRFWGTGAHEGVIAWQEGLPYQVRVSRDFWSLLHRDAVSFRYRKLFSFEKDELTEIALDMEGKTYRLYLQKGKVLKADNITAPQSRDIEKAVWYLNSLDASDVIGTSKPADVKDNPQLVFTIKRHGVPQELKVYNKSSVKRQGYSATGRELGLYYAWSGNLNAWCLLNEEDFEKLKEEFWK